MFVCWKNKWKILNDYKNLKLFSKNNIYKKLEIKKLWNNKDYGIYSTEDIPSNELLFEISGEILTYNQLTSKVVNLFKFFLIWND